MSGIIIIAPVVATTGWTVLASAAVSVMTAVGFSSVSLAEEVIQEEKERLERKNSVELKLANSEEVAAAVDRDEQLAFSKDDVTVIFSRDARGRLKICVEGHGYAKADLERFGQEIAGRVVQQYAYQRIMQEMQNQHLAVIDQEVDDEDNIRIKLRSWEE